MIYVIEPHADDAFLSLGGHIEKWVKEGQLVTIVTVFSSTRKRARDAEAYAKAVGARWLGLGAIEGCIVRDAEYALKQWLLGQDYGRTYVLPIAVSHPEHKLVRAVCEKYLPKVEANTLYYLDQPYASMTKSAPDVTREAAGMRLYSWLKPHSRKYRHIPLFKDQAKFFHFNPAEKLKHNAEVILQ